MKETWKLEHMTMAMSDKIDVLWINDTSTF